MFWEESGASLRNGKELCVRVALIVKLGLFIEHISKRPDLIADEPIGEGLL